MLDEQVDPEKANHVRCPQCKREFVLRWNGYTVPEKKQTVFIHSCPSGGIYDVTLECPYCDYEEDL